MAEGDEWIVAAVKEAQDVARGLPDPSTLKNIERLCLFAMRVEHACRVKDMEMLAMTHTLGREVCNAMGWGDSSTEDP